MAELYLLLLVIGIVWLLLRVVWNPVLIFEYPYFIAATFGVFIVPQAYSLLRYPGGVSEQAVSDVMLMSFLCLMAAAVGYRCSPSTAVFRRVMTPVDPGRLFQVGLVFIVVSFSFAYLMVNAEGARSEQGGMTGITTIYLFFVGLAFPGFAICFLLLLQKFSITRLIAVLVSGAIPLINVLGIRREPTVVLGLTIVLGIFYTNRKAPSRIVIFGALLGAMLAIPATGAYRAMLGDGEISKFRRLNLVDNFKEYFSRESILEFRNAGAVIESTRKFGTYEYGAGYWNQVVFRYVPAQLIGKERKNSLMIGTSIEKMNNNVSELGFEFSTGSTITGMGDSFRNFGWFGCMFFAVVGIFFRSVWLASLRPNAMFAQLLYIMICTSAMRAVTHQTVDFLPGLIYQAGFLGVGYFYARQRRNPNQPGSRVRTPATNEAGMQRRSR